MKCTVDHPAFELNWTYICFTLDLNFISMNVYEEGHVKGMVYV